MMSSLGSQGLTPLPSGPMEMGISTEINTLSGGPGSVLGTRNPGEDKARRLQEVVKLLRTRFTGRGICREGAERLAKLAGFTHMWQGDTLAIAGTCVDLEIEFDSGERDRAKDVVLKIFTPESEEHKKDASEVLKASLEQKPDSKGQEPWCSLEVFATNLEHLGRMDHLSQGINCFEAIDGLFATFKKIWDGETKRMSKRWILDRLSQGTIGRPVLNRKRQLGLSVEYWAERRHLPGPYSNQEEGDAIQSDNLDPKNEFRDESAGLWTARIECEAGYPSLRVSKDWIAGSIFDNMEVEEHGVVDERSAAKVAWVEPPLTLVRVAENGSDPISVDTHDAEIKIPKPPQVRFVVHLEPSVLVPLPVASSVLNKEGLSVALDDSKFTTYDQALQNLANSSSRSQDSSVPRSSQRLRKSVTTFDRTGKAVSHLHSSAFYSTPQIWCYPLQSVTFDHPKHLADLLPTLRQYLLLWTLLRSVVCEVSSTSTKALDQMEEFTALPAAQNKEVLSKKGVVKRSNVNPQRAKVNMLLGDGMGDALPKKLSLSNDSLRSHPTVALPVDVSLSLTSSSPSRPKLDLIWPLPTDPASATLERPNFASASIEIGPNGEIFVPSASGIPFAGSVEGLKSIAQVVGLSEDLGLLVEWVMEKMYESRP
jgi:Mediator of RNA polymerase II transcription subunit 1